MSRADTPTLLSLDHYSEILGLDPRHFNQMKCNAFPVVSTCESIWYQYDWMDKGKASREGLARAIAQAEQMIMNELEFSPAPRWFEAEKHTYPRQDRVLTNYGTIYYPAQNQDRRKTVTTRYGYFIEGGRKKIDAIGSNRPVQYIDLDGDGFKEIARVTVPYINANTSLTKEGIGVFPSTDTDEIKRIRGLKIGLTNTQVIIEGQSSQFVHPINWQIDAAINGDDATVFLDEVFVYYIHTSEQGTSFAPVVFEWERSTEINFVTASGVLRARNPNLGIVTLVPAVWDSATSTWLAAYFNITDEPYYANLYYRAGFPVNYQGRMAAPFDRAVAALATSLLTEPICGCGGSEKLAQEWQSRPTSPVAFEQLTAPFGPKNGAWEAWLIISQYLGVGYALT